MKPGRIANVPAGRMSADAVDPDDFIRWLPRESRKDATAAGFAPRERFDAYQSSYLDSVVRRPDTVRPHRMTDRVVDLTADTDGIHLSLSSAHSPTPVPPIPPPDAPAADMLAAIRSTP